MIEALRLNAMIIDFFQFKALPRVTLKKGGFKRKAESQLPRQHKRPLLEQNVDVSSHGSLLGARRRSARLQGSVSYIVLLKKSVKF